MTSHYRHRRTSNAAVAFPNPLEPGEIAVNTANRQIAAGDAAAGTVGAPLVLLAVRVFDARASYATGEFVVQGGQLYRAKAAITPGAFNAANWDQLSTDAVIKAYADAGDASVTSAFQAADTTLTTAVNGKVAKAGDTMTGALNLPLGAPTADVHATNKKYVDDAISAATGGAGSTAADISNVPAGGISATDVQAALNELDSEKVSASGTPSFVATPTAPAPPANDNSTKLINSAWFAGQASSAVPAMDAAAAPGVMLTFARGDHVHPTDTSRAPVLSPAFSGVPTAPTAAVDTNTTQLATCAFVLAQPVTNIANGIVTFIKMASSAIATAAEFLNNTANKILTADRVWAAAVPVSIASAATITPNCAQGIDFTVTLNQAGHTLANPTGTKAGQKGLIYLVQDGSGNRTVTTWGTAYKFPGGQKPALSTTANAIDVISYAVMADGVTLACSSAGGLA